MGTCKYITAGMSCFSFAIFLWLTTVEAFGANTGRAPTLSLAVAVMAGLSWVIYTCAERVLDKEDANGRRLYALMKCIEELEKQVAETRCTHFAPPQYTPLRARKHLGVVPTD